MRIVLVKKVVSLGNPGEVKEVSEGYGRNFLLPQGLAVIATASTIAQWQQKKQIVEAHKVHEVKQASILAKKLNNVLIEVSAKANKAGTLFGAVTPDQIIKKLVDQKIELDKKYLQYSEHIKKVGEHQVNFKLVDGSEGKIRVKVISL
ncbi:MAG: 50S ribosomal protein L9 [Patescibacteria group bacterium]